MANVNAGFVTWTLIDSLHKSFTGLTKPNTLNNEKKNGLSEAAGLTGDHQDAMIEAILTPYPAGSAEWDAVQEVQDIVYKMSNRRTPRTSRRKPNRHSSTMIRTVEEVSDKHDILFKGMIKKLKITSSNGDVIFIRVVDEIFADKLFNWGRIVTVYAFIGWLTRYCVENGLEDVADNITVAACKYVVARLSPWIALNGGWVRDYDSRLNL